MNVTQSGMSHKMECHLKLNVTQNGMSLKIEYHSKYHSKWNVSKNKCRSKLNVTQNRLSLKKGISPQNVVSLRMECHSK